MKIIGVIPARYSSTRFPGKPLAKICGKPMIQRVYEQALKAKSIDYLTVATDDKRIFKTVKNFGGNAVMTSINHLNGTTRCMEAVNIFQTNNKNIHLDVIVNIQGDEPFIKPEQIELLTALFNNSIVQIGTLAKKINTENELFSPNVVKIIMDKNFNALYFSRNTIPFIRNSEKEKWLNEHQFYKHIGIYAYRLPVLQKLVSLPIGKLEKAESLEQLRWLENGIPINLAITNLDSIGIDTQDDLLKLTNNPC